MTVPGSKRPGRAPLRVETHIAPIALALAALRDERGPNGRPVPAAFSLVMGPLTHGGRLAKGQAMVLGLFDAPDAPVPLSLTLIGRAEEPLEAVYLRKLPGRDVLAALRPRTANGPARVWAVAESALVRVAWPVTVIPDAQAMAQGTLTL